MPATPFEFLRSFTFGGLVGAGVAFLLYAWFPNTFAALVGPRSFVALGYALGGIFHRAIDTVILGPLGRFLDDYETIVELVLLRRHGVIDEEEQKSILNQVLRKRFLKK